MKSIITSVSPYLCEKIVSDDCKILVKKTAPKEVPFKAYIYMTQGTYKDLGLYSEGIYQNRMKVIGEFICDKVIKTCGWRLRGYTQQCAKRTPEEEILPRSACLSIDEIVNYAGGENGEICGWHISDLRICDEPKELSEFRTPKNPHRIGNSHSWILDGYKQIKQPPTSWQYVEEIS